MAGSAIDAHSRAENVFLLRDSSPDLVKCMSLKRDIDLSCI